MAATRQPVLSQVELCNFDLSSTECAVLIFFIMNAALFERPLQYLSPMSIFMIKDRKNVS